MKNIELFNKCNSVSDVLKSLSLSDNTNNRNKVKQMMIDVNFDINIYKERKKRYCKKCGKLLLKYQTKFCSSSCSASFNNIGSKKSDETKEKIRKTLQNKVKEQTKHYKKNKTEKIQNFCLNCGNEIKNNKKYCSSKCSCDKKHKDCYNHFLLNPTEFNRGNYTPKSFKVFFMEEQNNKCDICGLDNIWCDKKLVFVLDHIDGDSSNNNRNNLRMICPNCDSQTDTFKSKNKISTRRNYWKEKIIRDFNK